MNININKLNIYNFRKKSKVTHTYTKGSVINKLQIKKKKKTIMVKYSY